MEMLPDEVLLMVLEKLVGAKDILACRLVCKRLAALALHPAVWRDFSLGPTDPHCVCPVMRLAPCIDQIAAQLPEKGCRQWAYVTTRCGAESLLISVEGAGQAGYAAAIISRHEALGRLTNVQIFPTVVTDVTVLLGTLAATINLKKLCIHVYSEGISTAAPILGGLEVTPSLREFVCTLFPSTEPFVKFILSQHAATLEEVDLWRSASSLTCTSTVPLLAAVTNLTKLTCCCLLGMEALTACKSLRVLELIVNTESLNQPAVTGVAKLLRWAEQLRKVTLEYEPALRSLADVGVELVSALASSGRSRLETLRISNIHSVYVGDCPLLQVLVSALPSLSALRCLSLENVGAQQDALLLAIRHNLAPALQRVEVRVYDGRGPCGHTWIHGDTVKAVLSANPSLHLILDPLEPVCDRDHHERCQACELDCHAELRVNRPRSSLGVYSHDPVDECSEDHSGDSFELWIHLPL